MKKSLETSALLLCTLAAIAVAVLPKSFTYWISSSNFGAVTSCLRWMEAADLSTNAFISFRFLPPCSLFGVNLSEFSYIAALMCIAAAGFVLLFRKLAPEQHWTARLCFSVLSVSLAYLILGTDSVFWGVIAFIPLLSFLNSHFLQEASPRYFAYFALTIAVCGLQFFTANQLAVLASLTAFLFSLPAAGSLQNKGTRVAISLMTLLAISLTASLLAPAPAVPDYPFLAKVVSDDGIPGIIYPIFGSSAPIPLIDRQFVKSTWMFVSVFLFAMTALQFLRTDYSVLNRRVLYLALFLSASLIVDSALPERFATSSPLLAISRITPEAFYFSLSSLAVALCTICLLLFLATRERSILDTSILTVGLLASLISINNQGELTLVSNQSIHPSIRQVLSEGKSVSPDVAEKLVTPSIRLYSRHGSFLLNQADIYQSAFSKPNVSSVSASNPLSLENLLDGNEATSWSAGPQDGEEWLLLKLNQSSVIRGIELDTGAAPWDFPRGLRITVSESCQGGAPDSLKNSSIVFEQEDWQGIVNFTGEGLPYYGSQSGVKVVLNEAVSAKCILVEQIATHPYHWSVAEVRVLEAKN